MELTIERTLIDTPERTSFTADLFGDAFPLKIEPYIFHITSNQTQNYNGGYWDFFKLSNGGFYMAPDGNERFQVNCPEAKPDAIDAQPSPLQAMCFLGGVGFVGFVECLQKFFCSCCFHGHTPAAPTFPHPQ